MYGGRDATLVSANGAARNGIEHYKDRIVSRGVLLDMARFKGATFLPPGEAIYTEDLEACAAKQRVTIQSGDIVLIRTGDVGRRVREHSWGTFSAGDAPGLSFLTAPWLYDKQLAGIATDTWGAEVRPNELAGSFQPLHLVIIVNMGLLVGEIFDLEALGEDCARDGVYEFMFVAPPLPITRAVGSPINPQAIK
jgi:kynurenine formamidase